MFKRLEDFRFARWVKSFNLTSQVLLSLTLVAALNYVAARHFTRWDITSSHRYSLSAESIAYLDKVPRDPVKPVRLILIQWPMGDDSQVAQINAHMLQIRTLMREYVYSGRDLPGGPAKINFEEVDVVRQTGKAKELEEHGLKSDMMAVAAVAYGDHYHFLTVPDFYEAIKGEAKAFKGEDALTSAILDVTQTKQDKIYFTQGHGEMALINTSPRDGLSNLGQELRLRNFGVQNLDLTGTQEIPADASLIIIANPRIAFQPHEVQKLRDYLEKSNGRLMVFLEPLRPHGLEDLFMRWGIRAPDMLVMENSPERHTPEGDLIVVPDQRGGEITKFLADNLMSVLFGPSRPVMMDLTAPADERRKVRTFLFTSDNSYAERDYQHPPYTFDSGDIAGPLSLASIAELRTSDALGLPGGRLLVFGNSDFIANQRFDNHFGNPYLFFNSVYYMTNRQNLLNIPAKPVLKFSLGISSGEFIGLAWRMALLPVAFLVLGSVVYFLRHR